VCVVDDRDWVIVIAAGIEDMGRDCDGGRQIVMGCVFGSDW